ncbi:hypothetical protein O181_069855 [Austropuccinia psidii MF-1]|uniref:Uncharacterized protein n=1 Tax=Austropuccinia psidii MF-1 TaxID=1389203 RepID=A0A9Q3I8H3_9BASI|nr:hypothetical protein [Austropuccinia psidii MF-1]
MHLFPPEIQWCQYQMVISTSHQVIKAHHPEDSSRLKEACQSQIPMTPSRNHWLSSLTLFLQGNTGSSFSRDIQQAVPKFFSKAFGVFQTRSQERAQAFLTLTPRAPLDGTPAVPQLRAQLDRGPHMKGAAPSRKEHRGPRRSNSFSGVVGRFPGFSRTTFKGPGEDGEEEEENSVERKSLMVFKVSLLLWGNPKVLEDQLYPSIISLSLISLNHPYWP